MPTTLGLLWFSVLGGSAIHREIFGRGGLIGADGTVDTENALFGLLGGLPGGPALLIGAILLIAIFFITSADSGALVMSMISTGGDPNPKNWIRVFWAVLAALVAIALLLVGDSGLRSIQTAAILTALPFSVVMLLMCLSTAKAFHREHTLFLEAQRKLAATAIANRVSDQVSEAMFEQVERQVQEHLADFSSEQPAAAQTETPLPGPAVPPRTE